MSKITTLAQAANTQDLFPETLLVEVADGHTFTSSLLVAKHFAKRHDNLLQVIANLECSEGFSLLNFKERNYNYSTARNQLRTARMYHITRDGFAFLVGRLTGKKAAYWQEAFICAFNEMESQLHAQEQRYLAALDTIRPSLRPTVEGTQQGQSRLSIGEQLGKSPAAITYHRRVAKRLGLLVT